VEGCRKGIGGKVFKTRAEYEKICDRTFGLAGEAQATRIQIDLLLDIRDVLVWMRDKEMLEQIIEERELAVKNRNTLIDTSHDMV
jgi:hypothetical protein